MHWGLAAAVAIGQVLTSVPVRKISGEAVAIDPAQSAATVIVFISAECPISLEYADRLAALSKTLASGSVRFLAVAPNFNETDDAVRKMARDAELPFPVFRDPGANLAVSLGARMTPVAVVLDREGRIRYRGQIDDARNPARVKRETLRLAVEDILAGRQINEPETRSLGCAIKRAIP